MKYIMTDNTDIEQNNEQILNDIQSLQQLEQQLFTSLETNTNLTPQQQKQILEKTEQLSNMRINLYKTLSGVNDAYQNTISSSVGTLREQTVAIGIVENELNKSKQRLSALDDEKNNQIRLVEINDYYGDKYAEHASLMKIIIWILCPIIIVAFLNNKGFISNTIYYSLLVIISVIGAYYFWKTFASIILRDNMNYQVYDWYFNAPQSSSSSTSSVDPWMNLPDTCIGEKCCSVGQMYDASLNQCIIKSFTSENLNANNIIH
jgi:hypothetical protein